MVEIKNYLNNLPGSKSYAKELGCGENDFAWLYKEKTKVLKHHKFLCGIQITDSGYIREILIPFFTTLTWRSKKYLDFQD